MPANQLETFMAAIRRLESGSFSGKYTALGPITKDGSRARGAYQIMSKYWDGWAAQAGIPGADWRDPAAQDRVARHRMGKLYETFGSWELVAIAWFAGPGRAAQAAKQGLGSVAGIKDVLGTSVGAYVSKIVGFMDEYGPQASDNPDLLGKLDDQARESILAEQGDIDGGDPTSNVTPNAQIDAWFDAMNQASPVAPKLDMRTSLLSLVDTMSNAVAGGARTMMAPVDAPEIVDGLEPDRPRMLKRKREASDGS